jgi:hypothetical protein
MNWDSYGCMHHNYYVYANPQNGGRFLWLPWDLNESMLRRTQSGCPDPGSVMLDEIVFADPADPSPTIDHNWPLIRFILADAVYREDYKAALRSVLSDSFAVDPTLTRIRELHARVAPYVIGPMAVEAFPYTNTSQDRFSASLTTDDNGLELHLVARHAAVEAALQR